MYRYQYKDKIYYFEEEFDRLQLTKYSEEWIDYIPMFPLKRIVGSILSMFKQPTTKGYTDGT